MKRYRYFIIPIICIIIFAVGFKTILNSKYEEIKDKKDLTTLKHAVNNKVRDKGVLLKDKMKDDNDLMLLGSSELEVNIKENPINVFPFKGAEYDVSIYGTGHTQSLQHVSTLGSMSNLKSEDKLALIVSAQWFQYEEGIPTESFSPNFSEQQFYKIFSNNKLSKETKKAYAERTSELLGKDGNYVEEKVFSELYYRDDILSKIAFILLKPYYNLKEYMLDVKDKVQTIKAIEGLGDKLKPTINEFNFEQAYIDAENEGALKVTNNDINVNDSYYNEFLKERYPELKGYWKDVDLINSKELKDLELFLNASSELGVKPLIILPPVNGYYYDYIELKKEDRDKLYNTIEKMARDRGFEVLNLQNKEYEKYYLIDVMHLGWKGWTNVNEEIYKHFDKR